jgi:pyruvate/2-oxoglutarate dehydrogenase complex dihydrolipoamide acyltransferase (E2) component
MITIEQKEIIFRKFQIDKFNPQKSVPTVSMTIDINMENIQKQRNIINNQTDNINKITITHFVIKAVGDTLKDFPFLYSFFDGKRIVNNDVLKINIPVAENNHVEYVVIESPEKKNIKEISIEISNEVTSIKNNCGKFYTSIKILYSFPSFIRFFVHKNMKIGIRSAFKHYGNFPITNFGSFGVKNGTPVLSSPIVAALCIGLIEKTSQPIMAVTLVFDHRPIDGAYGGKFLATLKSKLETNNFME